MATGFHPGTEGGVSKLRPAEVAPSPRREIVEVGMESVGRETVGRETVGRESVGRETVGWK